MVKAAVDKADEQQHYEATALGGLKAASIGLAIALPAAFILQRRVPAFRNLTLPLKAFAITSATTATFIIGADSASRKYELAKYSVGSGTELEREAWRGLRKEREAGIGGKERIVGGRELSTKDALVEWGKENRYSVVFGSWAASMIGSFGYISMTPLSFAQKLVQARMVAQGLTVAVLIASAGLSSIPTLANGNKNDDEVKREEREEGMYKWKKGSQHDLEHQHQTAQK